MIRLTGSKVSAEVRAFVKWLEATLEVEHEVTINFVPRLLGYFNAPGAYDLLGPHIDIGIDDGSELLDTIAHEMVHYQQWRTKRRLTENVDRRANDLVKRFQRECA
jgi:hypothetical protein